ncbi:MAG: nucleoside triphosphate pyrophosphohydrolase [Spirochaetia bacterium]|nr:nucleoside triphosphate pyrophosphohydrolase [Spirochaetia bacterium]
MKIPPLDNPYLAIQKLASDLRDPQEGCPWDREQTHQSLIENLIEETYEVAQAVENLNLNDPETCEDLKEELGDLFFQVVFHSQLASEKKLFTLDDVVLKITEKLIARHPHVYGDVASISDSEGVLSNWEAIKRKEKSDSQKESTSALSGVPVHLPALLKSYRMGQKVSRLNFDWRYPDGAEQLFDKINEEYEELMEELPDNPVYFKNPKDKEMEEQKKRATLEFGDLFFVIAQLARHYHIDPEYALQQSNKKFERRFVSMEEELKEKLESKEMPTQNEWEQAWKNAKQKVG